MSAQPTNEGEQQFSPPYKTLYVYMLRGTVKAPDEHKLGSCFVGNWIEDNHSFLFFSGPSREIVCTLANGRLDLELLDEFELDYEQWQGQSLRPLEVGGFLIVPYWLRHQDCENERALTKILLDPGVVFGNGLHPTTQHCLRALQWLKPKIDFARVLDLGTGTGILAIASALLGARDVLAVDINPLCVRTTKKNICLNGLDSSIRAVKGRAHDFVDHRCDLVIANLDYEIISDLLLIPVFRTKPWYIFSGLLRTPYTKVLNLVEKYGMRVAKQWDHDMTWFTLACRGEGESSG